MERSFRAILPGTHRKEQRKIDMYEPESGVQLHLMQLKVRCSVHAAILQVFLRIP